MTNYLPLVLGYFAATSLYFWIRSVHLKRTIRDMHQHLALQSIGASSFIKAMTARLEETLDNMESLPKASVEYIKEEVGKSAPLTDLAKVYADATVAEYRSKQA